MPKLSVIVPAYNSQATLDQCLSAIKKSTFTDYELIVINDGSTDNTLKIAEKYTKNIVSFKQNQGLPQARKTGYTKAKSKIVVHIDSDVVIKSDSLEIIHNYFHIHPHITAITGFLEYKYPFPNFSTNYKNIYMYYYFSILPTKITFLYGSIFATIKHLTPKLSILHQNKHNEDSDSGQQIINKGKIIHLVKSLKVIHLKHYNLKTLLHNDFTIPYNWAHIFIYHQGWKQLGKNHTGYMHASPSQIISLFLAPTGLLTSVISIFNHNLYPISLILLITWFITNRKFFHFLLTHKDISFTFKSITYTYIDHLTMSLGVFFGTLHALKLNITNLKATNLQPKNHRL